MDGDAGGRSFGEKGLKLGLPCGLIGGRFRQRKAESLRRRTAFSLKKFSTTPCYGQRKQQSP